MERCQWRVPAQHQSRAAGRMEGTVPPSGHTPPPHLCRSADSGRLLPEKRCLPSPRRRLSPPPQKGTETGLTATGSISE